MPIIPTSTYRAPSWLPGGHAQTIHPVLFRKLKKLTYKTTRLELSDGDFLDLESSGTSRSKLAILCHGLEGSSKAGYMQGMATALEKSGWDVLMWSFRGCSGEPNRLAPCYHSGKTDDLERIIQHATTTHQADKIDLIGFSMGGNLMLKYLGERGSDLHPAIHRGVAFSTPCDLACCSAELAKWQNKIYMERFLKTLRSKVLVKHSKFPEHFDISGLATVSDFSTFDNRFTAPLHGFKSASDYWRRNSCKQFLEGITIPTLLVNAANDPFLGGDCYPFAQAERNPYFFLEVPVQGGHIGFGGGREYWSERRAIDFLTKA